MFANQISGNWISRIRISAPLRIVCGDVHALQFCQAMILNYFNRVLLVRWGFLCILFQPNMVERCNNYPCLPTANKLRQRKLWGELRPANKRLESFFQTTSSSFSWKPEIQQTSKMWIKRISPHQYLSQVTGGKRAKGEFITKKDSIFQHFADIFLPGLANFANWKFKHSEFWGLHSEARFFHWKH